MKWFWINQYSSSNGSNCGSVRRVLVARTMCARTLHCTYDVRTYVVCSLSLLGIVDGFAVSTRINTSPPATGIYLARKRHRSNSHCINSTSSRTQQPSPWASAQATCRLSRTCLLREASHMYVLWYHSRYRSSETVNFDLLVALVSLVERSYHSTARASGKRIAFH